MGLLLAFGLPSLAGVAWAVLALPQVFAAVLTQVGEVLGFASVLYGLRFA